MFDILLIGGLIFVIGVVIYRHKTKSQSTGGAGRSRLNRNEKEK